MALETGSYVSDLVQTNPTGTDPKSQGDDHLRLIKQVLRNTFPDADAAFLTKDAVSKTLDQTITGLKTLSSSQTRIISAPGDTVNNARLWVGVECVPVGQGGLGLLSFRAQVPDLVNVGQFIEKQAAGILGLCESTWNGSTWPGMLRFTVTPANGGANITAMNIASTGIAAFLVGLTAPDPVGNTNPVTLGYYNATLKPALADLASVQTISGVKTFSATPLATNQPTAANELANKAYVDAAVPQRLKAAVRVNNAGAVVGSAFGCTMSSLGAGAYRLTFTTPLADVSKVVISATREGTTTVANYGPMVDYTNLTTTKVDITTRQGGTNNAEEDGGFSFLLWTLP